MAAKQNIESIYRLTPAQEGILFHVIRAPESGAYFQQFTCVLSGEIDCSDFEEAWRRTLAHHPAMRALFTWEGRENPLQVVRRQVELPFEVIEDAELAHGGERLESWLAADRKRGFRLDHAPLMRVTLVRRTAAAAEARLIWSFHHLSLDGWSMRAFWQQVLECYAALRNRTEPPRNEALSHERYVAWLASRDAASARDHWQRLLQGFETPTDLQLPRPQSREGAGEEKLSLSRDTSDRLRKSAREARVTLSTMMRGIWSILLQRYGPDDDVVFGATVSGRDPALEGVESVVGMCINTVPVRAHVADTDSIGDLVRALQEQQLEGAPFETTSLVDIQRMSSVPGGTALFETILVFENHPVASATAESNSTTRLDVREPRYIERSNYPLALLVIPGNEIELILVYNEARFEDSAIQRLASHLRRVLDQAARDTTIPIGKIDLLNEEEAHWLQAAAIEHGESKTTDSTAHDVLSLFCETADEYADREALRFDGRSTGYAELRARVLELATDLRARGVMAETRVGICIDRSVEMITAMFGVLAAGGAYVPIDPDWPEDRIRYVLRDSEAALVVTTTARAPCLPEGTIKLRIDAPESHAGASTTLDAPTPVTDDTLAYILYTSGSTGVPKGVEITHGNLGASTRARFEFYARASDLPARFLLLSAYHFDSSVAGIYWTLCSGGTLVLARHDATRDVRLLADLIAHEAVTHTLCLPSLYEPLLEVADGDELESFRTVIVAGEACPTGLVRAHFQALPHAELVNEYGPTEATVWATAYRIDTARDTTADRPIPIGKPVGNTQLLILDRSGRPVPRGVAGEIHLGGDAIARGYTNDAERTAAQFTQIATFGREPKRLYRTGDLARFRVDGNVEFLGRVDDQVKIRGHRIELGSIEARLRGIEGVQDAAVVARDLVSGRASGLIAYVVTEDAHADAHILRDALGETLPAVMVPGDFVMLDALPRTSSGKIDRSRLPAPARGGRQADSGHRVPANDVEAKLAEIWCDILDLDSVSTDSNFFELGGDSLLSIRIIARAHSAGLRIDPASFASKPTIQGMSAAASTRATAQDTTTSPTGPLPLTPIQDWFFGLDLPEPHHWNQAQLIELPRDADAAHVRAALRAVVDSHDALRLRFTKTASGWQQEVSRPAELSLECWDLTEYPESERDEAFANAASKLQSTIDLASGQLLRAALVRHEKNGAPRLLIVIHHLAVDAVSWGILVEDLNEAYDSARSEATAPNRRSGASFAHWVRALAAHAGAPSVQNEIEYWSSLATATEPGLPIDRAAGRQANRVDSEATVTTTLDADTTRALLQDVPSVYGTRIQEVLATALVLSMSEWTNARSLYFDIEGHGRETHIADIDLSRCVGWMTSVWPVALRLPASRETGEALKSIKEQMRRVPAGGIGFGLLRVMSDDPVRRKAACVPRADLLFNYLGRRDSTASSSEAIRIVADAPVGACRSSLGMRGYLLEINAIVDEHGALRTTWSYSASLHRRETVERLAKDWNKEIESIVEHCANPSSGGKTPSDFPLAGLDQSQLDRLSDLLGDDS